MPGNGVAGVNATTDHVTAARPSQPNSDRPRQRSKAGVPRAMRPPTASSQARVGNEKNAHGCDALVNQTENTNDEMAITPSTAAAAPREARPRRARRPRPARHAVVATTSTAGQSKSNCSSTPSDQYCWNGDGAADAVR